MNEIEQKIALIAVGGTYLLMLLLSLYFIYYPPKGINSLYGYRTFRSMKNQENWNFANKLSAKYMLINTLVGFAIFVISFFLLRHKISVTAMILGNLGVQSISLVVLIPMVEIRLRKFEENQNAGQA
jgi:uncharacterized membrane protein